jgi:selenocysteine lyase/cysteine desulfurase
MANAALPPCDGATLGRRLWEEYRIEVPVIAWQGRWFLRVSIQGYNDAADIDRLLTVLGKLLPEVRV